MLNVIIFIGLVVFGFVSMVVLNVFLRALSTRAMTGKWPHQSDEAKEIFDCLP